MGKNEMKLPELAGLNQLLKEALDSARLFVEMMRSELSSRDLPASAQYQRHGFAWYAAYVEAMSATTQL